MIRTTISSNRVREQTVTLASAKEDIYQDARKRNTIAESQYIAERFIEEVDIFSTTIMVGNDLVIYSVS
jgi:hypothetical protein